MPENTEVLNMKDECCAPVVEKHDSGTDSDSDDSIPELEGMAIPVIEFQVRENKIRKIFA